MCMLNNKREMNEVKVRICLCGLSGVGKSSLLRRYRTNTFDKFNESTIGAAFAILRLPIRDGGVTCVGECFDTAGQERYAPLLPMYTRNANSIVIVGEADAGPAMAQVRAYIQQFTAERPANCHMLNVVINKADQYPRRVTDAIDTLQEEFSDNDIHFWITSALTGKGVEELFNGILHTTGNHEWRVQQEAAQARVTSPVIVLPHSSRPSMRHTLGSWLQRAHPRHWC